MTGNLSTKNREGFQETRRKSSGRQSCSRPKALVAEEAQKTWTESVVIMRKMATAEYLKYKEGFFHMAIAGIPGSRIRVKQLPLRCYPSYVAKVTVAICEGQYFNERS